LFYPNEEYMQKVKGYDGNDNLNNKETEVVEAESITTIDLRKVKLFGYEYVDPYVTASHMTSIKNGDDDYDPVLVDKINDDLYVLIPPDGGHHRSVAHYRMNKPLKIKIVDPNDINYEYSGEGFTYREISEQILRGEKIDLDYAVSIARIPLIEDELTQDLKMDKPKQSIPDQDILDELMKEVQVDPVVGPEYIPGWDTKETIVEKIQQLESQIQPLQDLTPDLKYVKAIKGARRVFVHGDIHADYDGFRTNLLAAGVIDENNKLLLKQSEVFVITGDIVDRATQNLETIRMKLPTLKCRVSF
jgi:hypothetical protein